MGVVSESEAVDGMQYSLSWSRRATACRRRDFPGGKCALLLAQSVALSRLVVGSCPTLPAATTCSTMSRCDGPKNDLE